MTERMDDFRKDAMAVVMEELSAGGDSSQVALYILHALETKYTVIQDSPFLTANTKALDSQQSNS